MKVFKEEQKFTQWWLWLFLIAMNLLFLFGLYKQLILKKSFGDNPMSDIGLIVFVLFFLLFTLFFYILKLETKIDEFGIHSRFFPIQTKYKSILWKDMESATVIKYRPIRDYGGWGMKGNSYTVKGNKGIQIYLKKKAIRLIGTQKETEAKQVLATYKNKITQ